jgi:transcriptional regulator with XRE-family HTH domain
MVDVADLVRAARRSRRLTQQQLAERTHIDQATVSRTERGRDSGFTTIDRLLSGAGHRLYLAPTRRDDAASVAAQIRRSLRVGDKDGALRALIQLGDNLAAERGLVRGVLAVAEPASTSDAVWDAAIAALVAWRLDDDGLPAPEWVNGPSRFLSGTHSLNVDPADPPPPPEQVPAQFSRRGVLVWRDTFASV